MAERGWAAPLPGDRWRPADGTPATATFIIVILVARRPQITSTPCPLFSPCFLIVLNSKWLFPQKDALWLNRRLWLPFKQPLEQKNKEKNKTKHPLFFSLSLWIYCHCAKIVYIWWYIWWSIIWTLMSWILLPCALPTWQTRKYKNTKIY